ncbi:MAG TPA: tRNA pseudouridine(55) synthase TruB [Selenomonadales bacterium]|nr:tRNA pseudouridine(55) synthase TruB [Selenomonadales bacterium]
MTGGIINVLKPPGMTSHDVVAFVRRVYGLKKVGHAGTLDPAAAGILPVFLGPATRLIEYTADRDKAYRVELTFGYATDTGDDTGAVIRRASTDGLPAAGELFAVLQDFVGTIDQIPPMHSAIKIAGKKLYELAREGIEIERQPRKVVIKAIRPIKLDPPVLLFDVACSKGTYIRSLCLDIGERLGCPATMSFLVRTRVGDFDLDHAFSLEEIAAEPKAAVLPAEHAVRHLPGIILPSAASRAFGNGQVVACEAGGRTALYAVFDERGVLVGIGESTSGQSGLKPLKVMPH